MSIFTRVDLSPTSTKSKSEGRELTDIDKADMDKFIRRSTIAHEVERRATEDFVQRSLGLEPFEWGEIDTENQKADGGSKTIKQRLVENLNFSSTEVNEVKHTPTVKEDEQEGGEEGGSSGASSFSFRGGLLRSMGILPKR